MGNRGQFFEIRVEGHLGDSWSPWFEGMTICHKEGGETVLSGVLVDQTALHGVLIKIRDLGLPLVSATRSRQTDSQQPSMQAVRDDQE